MFLFPRNFIKISIERMTTDGNIKRNKVTNSPESVLTMRRFFSNHLWNGDAVMKGITLSLSPMEKQTDLAPSGLQPDSNVDHLIP